MTKVACSSVASTYRERAIFNSITTAKFIALKHVESLLD